MRIIEISYADAIPSIDWNNVDLSSAIPVTTIDGQTILEFIDGSISFYLIKDNGKVQAYAAIERQPIQGYYPLVRIENIAQIKGLVTILIYAITLKKNLIIKKTEELTPDGLHWLGKMLSNGGRGLSFYDQNGNPVDFDDLTKEHSHARIQLRATGLSKSKTAILIVNDRSKEKLHVIQERAEIWNSSSLLKPPYLFLTSDDLW